MNLFVYLFVSILRVSVVFVKSINMMKYKRVLSISPFSLILIFFLLLNPLHVLIYIKGFFPYLFLLSVLFLFLFIFALSFYPLSRNSVNSSFLYTPTHNLLYLSILIPFAFYLSHLSLFNHQQMIWLFFFFIQNLKPTINKI